MMHGYEPGTVFVGSDGFYVATDSAFALLTWRSQESNVKVRLLDGQVVEDLLGLSYDEVLPTRSAHDRLLLTARLRVGSQWCESLTRPTRFRSASR
jgi:hypothetical protein